ncbi:MAG: Uncharacterised protein [Opitutia bacterium UBA7350]|nr:MAG: Uncharacterised protein [Opitutae bacterium UBA7350]
MKHLLFLLAFGISAQASLEPVAELQSTVTASVEALFGEGSETQSIEAKRDAVKTAFEKNYNMDIIIRRAIGRNWRRLSSEEQAQILMLVKEVVLKAFIDGMVGKSRPEISYDTAVEKGGKRLEIPSTIKIGDLSLEVKYKLALMQSGWELYDLVAEGISLVLNYRQQFDQHFRQGSASELIEKLEALLKHEKLELETQI